MEPADFTDNRAGRLLKAPEDYWAFVPDPLPPTLRWDADLVLALSAADRAIGQLAGVGQTLANPHLLIRPFIRREAVLSSRIEGTLSSLSDLFLFEATPASEPAVPDVREVANYVQAMEFALGPEHGLPLSLRLIRQMHAHLMEGVRGEHMTPGEFRKTQNWIGPPNCMLNDATYVPPPPYELNDALGLLERYLHAPSELPPLVRLAAIHYQFEAIHPFLDGNGRIGRLLTTLILCFERLLPQPLLYLSAYFEKRRNEYYDHLLAVSQGGRWNEWIIFFLRGVSEQADDAVRRSNKLLKLRQQFHEQCHVAGRSALLLKLVDGLFSHPATTTSLTTMLLEVTQPSAQANIDKLIGLGILEEVTGRKRDRVYVARDIVSTIDAPEAGD